MRLFLEGVTMDFFEGEKELERLLECKTTWITSGCCSSKFHTTWLHPKDEEVDLFNQIYDIIKDWRDAALTSRGYISKDRYFRFYSKAVVHSKSGIELLIVTPNYCHRVIMTQGYGKSKEGRLSGKVAFSQFAKRCKKLGLDLKTISISNGKEVKETIRSPDIYMEPEYANVIVEHSFHVDINSAYMAGIKLEYGHLGDGVLGEVIDDIYYHRSDGTKASTYNKAILNCTQGYMQSRWCTLNGNGYALAHLSKAGIHFCHDRLMEIIQLYKDRDCKLIATNTDGAWFEDLHPNTEGRLSFLEAGTGSMLGGFKIDHWNCKLRYKSAGAYEYIENGIYTPVIRGRTALDRIRPRDQWGWGDIYDKRTYIVKYLFVKGRGLVDEKKLIEEKFGI